MFRPAQRVRRSVPGRSTAGAWRAIGLRARNPILPAAVAAVLLAPAAAQGGLVLADSAAEFSGVQGESGWFYGAYRGALNPASFAPMTSFSGANWWAEPGAGGVWTSIWATGQRGNGAFTTGGRRGEQQWAARRWVSDYDGNVRVRVSAASASPHCRSSGATARLFLDGAQVWSADVEGSDGVGVAATLTLDIAAGSTLDFIVDPDPTFTAFDALDLRAVIEPACAADADLDGDQDVADLLAFLTGFRTGRGDWNGDGSTNVQDLLAFLTAFRSAC